MLLEYFLSAVMLSRPEVARPRPQVVRPRPRPGLTRPRACRSQGQGQGLK